jgi:hypothetical protein
MPLIYAGQRVTASTLALNYAASDIGAVTVTQATLTDLTGTFTVPANDSAAGNIYEIEAWGNGTWGGAGTTQNLTFQAVFGGSNMTSLTLDNSFLVAGELFRFRVSTRVVCLTTGVTGTFQSLLHGEMSKSAANLLGSAAYKSGSFVSCESSGTTTIDTTAGQGLKLQANWAATTGAPTITKRVAIQRKLGLG